MGKHSKDLPITIDYEAEAMYIKLKDNTLHHTEEIIPCELNFCYDNKNNIIGIEILRNPIIKDITDHPEKKFTNFINNQGTQVMRKYKILDIEGTGTRNGSPVFIIYVEGHQSNEKLIKIKKDITHEFNKYLKKEQRSDFIDRVSIIVKQKTNGKEDVKKVWD